MKRHDATRLAAALFCAAAVAVPFLAVSIPPIADLPQQSAQIRLLAEAVGEGGGELVVQWWHPNKLGYLPLAAGWAVAPPLAAGRVGMLLLGVLWVGAVHGLARAAGRPAGSAAVASLFFFNHVTYWGFLNFLAGFPVFCLGLVLLHRRGRRPAAWRELPWTLSVAALLYSAHVLWLAASLLLLAGWGLRHRWRLRSWVLRLLPFLPFLALVAVWYPTFTAGGFDSETTWGRSPLGRLHPGWLLNSAFGGLHGGAETAVAVAVLLWLALGAWPRRRGYESEGDADGEPERRVDGGLLAAGLFFLLLALVLPGVHQHTIFFASRWLPVAAALLVLAVPAPPLRPALRLAFPLLLVAALSAATTAAWIGFERAELAGLHRALDRLTAEGRLLGLDFVRTSERIRGYPYYHLYAYGQVLRGVDLARTFADEASSLVVHRDLPRSYPWTPGLDWRARKVRRSDVPHFRQILIHGPPEVHRLFSADPRLRPVTGVEDGAPWRLYRTQIDRQPSAPEQRSPSLRPQS